MSCSCITDQGYIDAANKQADAIVQQAAEAAAITVGIAFAQRTAGNRIAGMQEEIAKRQVKLAEAIHDHAKKYWPAEKALVDDAFGLTKAEPQYVAMSASWSQMTRDSLARAKTDWIKTAKEICTYPTRCETARWDRFAQNARADMISFANRQAEGRAETLNDRRYNWQYSALGLGRNILSNISSYQDIAARSGDSAAAILAGSINSGLTALGYYRNRNDPPAWEPGPTHRAPFTAPQPGPAAAQPVAVASPVSQSRVSPVSLPAMQQDCGPMPSTNDDAAWARWNDCMRFK